MEVNPFSTDCVEIRNWIDAEVLKLYRGLAKGNLNDATKDVATTWWTRGQIAGLEEIKKQLMVKDEK